MKSVAELWAEHMQHHRLARPGCFVDTMDHANTQPPVKKEIAFIASYDGEPRLQLKGGVLTMEGALVLADFISATCRPQPDLGPAGA